MRPMRERLSDEIPAASLAAFRIVFGLAGAFAATRFIARGWVDELLVAPVHHLHYAGFGFVVEPPRAVLYGLYVAMVASSLAIAAGFFYRLAAVAYFLAFTYVELIDQALYLNHYYAVSLLSFLLVVLPLGDAYSLDAKRRGSERTTIPAYALVVVRAQLGLVYFFAGIAKLHADWLIRAEPLTTWLDARTDLPLIGAVVSLPFAPLVMSWAGMLFDVSVPFLLAWRRTRLAAYAAVVVFHTLTGLLFNIGLFPLLMIVFTPVFFEPDWPLRFVRIARGDRSIPEPARPITNLRVGALVAWFVVQLVVPLRHLAIPGDRLWTYDGFNFAWHVMLVEKGAHADLVVVDHDTGRRMLVGSDDYYTPLQIRSMSEDPALVVQFAHLVADEQRRSGHPNVSVYARSYAALNGRAAQPLVDPTIDLTTIDEWTPAYRYVVPLRENGRFEGFALDPTPTRR